MSTEAIAIREAIPEDAAGLNHVIETVNTETEYLGMPGVRMDWADTAADFLRDIRQKRNGAYFVVERGGELIGFLSAFKGWLERTRPVIFIGHVGIRAAFRARGLGARLFQAAEAWAKAEGARRLELRVAETNLPGQALYRQRGFRSEGRIVDGGFRGGRYQSDHWMGLVLAAGPEPLWESIEIPRQAARRALPDLVLRAPEENDAAGLQTFERRLLADSPIHLKRASEISDLASITTFLAASGVDGDRLSHAAFVGAGPQQIVGYVAAWFAKGYRSEHDVMFTLNVLPEFSGCSIGGALARILEQWARARGKHRLTTWLLAHNARGLRFAERLGFLVEVRSPNYAVIDGRLAARVTLGKLLD